MSKLLIIESPGKIKKLGQILGQGWKIVASFGHIRELSREREDYNSMGFGFSDDRVICCYVPRSDKAKTTIKTIVAEAKKADAVYLATDPDREGETIAWHIAQILQEAKVKTIHRVTYQSITESAVKQAIDHPRTINLDLADAGRCRDCLDKQVGYGYSPIIWRLNNGAKSVGRVQSATAHLVALRERQIKAFRSQNYWSVAVEYAEEFKALYMGENTSQKVEAEEELDDATVKGETKQPESTRVPTQAEADRLVQIAKTNPHQVVSVEYKQQTKQPVEPFTTSSLQQVAGSKLKFSPDQTMQVAQKLYEGGLITYMRTDSTMLSEECIAQGRKWLETNAPHNLPTTAKTKVKKGKNSQDAHEAIRPTNFFTTSGQLKLELAKEQFDLYLLIWKRTMASLSAPALLNKSTVVTESGGVYWRARGQSIAFAGYLEYWSNLAGSVILPTLAQDQLLTCQQATAEAKQTQPPPRYTEPQLVREMEKKGIGRPSTFAPTIATIRERQYVSLEQGKLFSTDLGMEVDDFLLKSLPSLVDLEFTAQMEKSLDAIASGSVQWENFLNNWHRSSFIPALKAAQQNLPELPSKDQVRSTTPCPGCSELLLELPLKKSTSTIKHFLRCDTCKAEDGRSLVLFWSDSQKCWSKPGASILAAEVSDIPCQTCQKPMRKMPSSKVSGGFYLRCEKCKDSVQFWDDDKHQWQTPATKKPPATTRKRSPKKSRAVKIKI
jgi:DNA topoisomerase I